MIQDDRWSRAGDDVPGVGSVIGDVQSLIDRALGSRRPIRVLEAGCGSCSHFVLGSRAFVVGVDICQEQLTRNRQLDEAICADLETCDLPAEKFDLVVCWYVMEHLRHPQRAMANLAAALGRNGILVLAMPCVWSLKGLVTKMTPHWFHVFFYRRVLGRKNAGVEGQAPFPTFLRWAIRPSAMRRLADDSGLSVELCRSFEDYTQRGLRRAHRAVRAMYGLAELAARALSGGRFSVYRTDFVMVLRKEAEA